MGDALDADNSFRVREVTGTARYRLAKTAVVVVVVAAPAANLPIFRRAIRVL